MSVEQRREDVTVLSPIPGAIEQNLAFQSAHTAKGGLCRLYLDDLSLQKWILDVPRRGEECETPDKHFILPGQLKALRALTAFWC